MPIPDIETLQQISARALRHAERFSLPLRDHSWRGALGDRAGTGTGSSLEFQDHRAYQPGDDPRHINWSAYARTGDYTLKLYRKEVRPMVDLILDASGSMFSEAAKAERAIELLQLALISAEKAGASTQFILLKGTHWRMVERTSQGNHQWAEMANTLPDTDSASPPLALPDLPLRMGSLRVLLSDLLFPSDPRNILRNLVRQSGRAIVLAPYAATEATPPWGGPCELVDTESNAIHPRRIDAAQMRRYLIAYQTHFNLWKSAALHLGIPLARIPAEADFHTALQIEAIPRGALSFV